MLAKLSALAVCAALAICSVVSSPVASADNKRLNDAVVANVFTVQHQAGCTNDVTINPQLQVAAERQARDMLTNRDLDGDIGSDGSTPQTRAQEAGYAAGPVTQTVATNPALAISGIELINQWYYDPASYQIMANCANNEMGVWSENSPDRTVVVAVYGQRPGPPQGPAIGGPGVSGTNPNPDYDVSDKVEYFFSWLPWAMRGAYPPPAYPPQ